MEPYCTKSCCAAIIPYFHFRLTDCAARCIYQVQRYLGSGVAHYCSRLWLKGLKIGVSTSTTTTSPTTRPVRARQLIFIVRCIDSTVYRMHDGRHSLPSISLPFDLRLPLSIRKRGAHGAAQPCSRAAPQNVGGLQIADWGLGRLPCHARRLVRRGYWDEA